MRRIVILSILLAACGPDTVEQAEPVMSVIRSLTFEREDPRGVSLGMNLDGFVSESNDGRSCNKEDFTSPDGTEGVDNELARLLPLVDIAGENAVEALVQDAIDQGTLLVMLELQEQRDGAYRLRGLRGQDKPLLGTDGLVLEGQTLALDPENPVLAEGSAEVIDGVLTTGAFEFRLPIVVFSQLYEVQIPEAYLRFTLSPDGRVEDGLIAGGIPIDQLLTILQTASEFAGDFEELFGDAVRDSGDLDRDAEGNCTRMSVAVSFTAVRAYTF